MSNKETVFYVRRYRKNGTLITVRENICLLCWRENYREYRRKYYHRDADKEKARTTLYRILNSGSVNKRRRENARKERLMRLCCYENV